MTIREHRALRMRQHAAVIKAGVDPFGIAQAHFEAQREDEQRTEHAAMKRDPFSRIRRALRLEHQEHHVHRSRPDVDCACEEEGA